MRLISTSAARFAAVLILPFALAGQAMADDPVSPVSPQPVVADAMPTLHSIVVVSDEVSPAGPAFGAAVAMERLEGMRGGDGNTTTTTNQADLNGRVNGNTATNVIGGGNLVSEGSFGNSAGISTVIQNSGSNVLIQNSTIVNVQFVDPTP